MCKKRSLWDGGRCVSCFLLRPLTKPGNILRGEELLTWPFPEDRTPLFAAKISASVVIFNYFAKNIHFQFWAKSPRRAFIFTE